MQGVPTGPRGYGWIPTEPATLIWAEALDGGDPRTKVTPRDKLMKLAAPFTGDADRAAKDRTALSRAAASAKKTA